MRTRICLYILLLTPILVYWPTVFHDYGVRSDYSHLRTAEEEPGRLVKLYMTEGRPLYGAMLEATYSATGEVNRLEWPRLCTVLLLTLLGLIFWRQMYNSGWNEVEAAGLGLGVLLLPSAQVLVGSASGWAPALSLLLAMAGFSAVEAEVERGGLKRIVAFLGGCMIYAVASLIAPVNVLFAFVPITGVLLARAKREPVNDLRWGLIHLGVLLVGVVCGLAFLQAMLPDSMLQEAGRLQLEAAATTKLPWFMANPLTNALALYAINDDFQTGAAVFWGSVVLVVGILFLAYRKATASGEAAIKWRWMASLATLPLLVAAIPVVTVVPASSYSVLFALCGVVLVLVVISFRSLVIGEKVRPWRHYPLLAAIWGALALSAHHNAYNLVAEPQGHEWELVRTATLRGAFNKPVRVRIITPTLEDRSTTRVYGGEFGAISSADPRVAEEMFKAALRERFGSRLPKGGSYAVTASPTEPAKADHDLLIDLRRLKTYRAE
jgi:hypothetical protein